MARGVEPAQWWLFRVEPLNQHQVFGTSDFPHYVAAVKGSQLWQDLVWRGQLTVKS
jgi:hypothetical protein